MKPMLVKPDQRGPISLTRSDAVTVSRLLDSSAPSCASAAQQNLLGVVVRHFFDWPSLRERQAPPEVAHTAQPLIATPIAQQAAGVRESQGSNNASQDAHEVSQKVRRNRQGPPTTRGKAD